MTGASLASDIAAGRALRTPRIDDIEWLRAFAVLGVMYHHAYDNLFPWRPHWLGRLLGTLDYWSGVDIFFAISGFVIARRLLPALRRRSATGTSTWRTIGAFWLARATRLLPSAWLWLGLIVLAAWRFNAHGYFMPLQANVMATWAGVFQYANVRFAHAFGSFPYGASFAYWSLSLEEQFYLALPLLAWLLRRWLWLALVVAVLIQASWVDRSLMQVSFRTDALALGVLLALGRAQSPDAGTVGEWLARHRTLARLACWLALLAIGYVSTWQGWGTGRRYSIVAVLAAGVVWVASYDLHVLSGGDSVLKRALLWIGRHSYAMYLIHVPVFFALVEAWARVTGSPPRGGPFATLALAALAALLIAILAGLNYRWVEQPLRRAGRRWATRIDPAQGRKPAIAPSVEPEPHV